MDAQGPIQHVSVNGLKIGYRRSGSGETIVLMHGGAGSGLYWKDVHALLAKHFDVISWDMVGYGTSDKPDASFIYTPASIGDFMLGFLNGLNIPTATIVGQSAGGLGSAHLAAHHPDRVRRLVLVTVPYVTQRQTFVHKMIDELAEPDGSTRMTLDFYRREIDKEGGQAEVDEWNNDRLIPAGPSFARLVRGIYGFELLPLARKLTVPTLIIWGNKTWHRPPEDATMLAEAIPNSTLKFIDGYEVASPMDAPGPVAEAITEFERS